VMLGRKEGERPVCTKGDRQQITTHTVGTHESYIKPTEGLLKTPPRRRVIFLAADRGLVSLSHFRYQRG